AGQAHRLQHLPSVTGMRSTTPDSEAAQRVRDKLRGRTGRAFWRSLDELSRTAELQAWLAVEFPALAAAPAGIDRRALLKVMAASFALAGLAGCDGEADEEALPYVEAPEFVIPGQPKFYATSVALGGYAQ